MELNAIHREPCSTRSLRAANESVCLMQNLVATNSAALDVADLTKLCLKTFWSATWMEAPPILLQPEQFAGWMSVLHTLLVRPVPEVRHQGFCTNPTFGCRSCRSMEQFAGCTVFWSADHLTGSHICFTLTVAESAQYAKGTKCAHRASWKSCIAPAPSLCRRVSRQIRTTGSSGPGGRLKSGCSTSSAACAGDM